MKKIIFFLINSTLLACSSNDAPPQEYTYKVYITQTCPSGTKTGYEVSKNTYETIDSQMQYGVACLWVTFKDIHYDSKKGYLGGIERVSK